ncbi:unnamed protein product [Closterium sp. Yama58-4]|nr:unnamed protein product [Closterium sp. Yama58-4]
MFGSSGDPPRDGGRDHQVSRFPLPSFHLVVFHTHHFPAILSMYSPPPVPPRTISPPSLSASSPQPQAAEPSACEAIKAEARQDGAAACEAEDCEEEDEQVLAAPIRQEKCVPESWRRPKGIDSRVRRKFKGTPLMPNIGYGSNKKTRHMLRSGFQVFRVHNERDVELLLMHNRKYVAQIASAVSTRKRKAIVERAQQLDVKVINGNARLRSTEDE